MENAFSKFSCRTSSAVRIAQDSLDATVAICASFVVQLVEECSQLEAPPGDKPSKVCGHLCIEPRSSFDEVCETSIPQIASSVEFNMQPIFRGQLPIHRS